MNKIKMEVISVVKWEDKEVPVADLLKELLEQNAKQKNSIDKAIEYIKINNLYYYDRLEVNVYKERFKEDIDKLLNMLKGSEE